ncbi:aminoglycoside phosphotransferase family protein [Microlunatus speluncae]|uniref:aminoglycoside phosphotransferase family protein n=1 Tax=Microlunatus speluncae TaxID=2594267 RepID=UPI0013756E18|nr:aminoglycoside phosphotransferase family protein [Microlunatus speluncae]
MQSEDETPLTGGFVNEVTKVGNTVRRTSGPWTPAVQALLHHLEAGGFTEAPRALGIDDRGREVLSYLPGETIPWTDWPAELCAADGVGQLGRLLRRYHDAVRTFTPPADAVWRNPLARSGELIRHGDFSPFNTTWVRGQVVGVIDWDFAQPGSALDDLAYLAWQLVPLQPRERARQYGIPAEVDLRTRLRVLCDAYGGDHAPAAVIMAAVKVIEREREHTAQLAAEGLHPWTGFARDGSLEAFAREADWLRRTMDWWIGQE